MLESKNQLFSKANIMGEAKQSHYDFSQKMSLGEFLQGLRLPALSDSNFRHLAIAILNAGQREIAGLVRTKPLERF